MTSLSRRELLTAFLGTAVWQLGCKRPAPSIDGLLLDSGFVRAHRLRDASFTSAARRAATDSAPSRTFDVCIVGAGAAGLSAAYTLRRSGLRVAVFELADAVGGNTRSGQTAGTSPLKYPFGAHYVPAPTSMDQPVAQLCRDMGLLESVDAHGTPTWREDALVAEPDERIYAGGQWSMGLLPFHQMTAADHEAVGAMFADFDAQAAKRTGLGAPSFRIPAATSFDDRDAALDKMTFEDWLRSRGHTNTYARWICNYATRDDFGTALSQTSAWAGLWYFASRRNERGERSEGHLTWPEGNAKLTQFLGAESGARIEPNAMVAAIRVEAHGVTLALHNGLSPDAPFETVSARALIYAGPRFVLPHLLVDEPLASEQRELASRISYAPWLVANIELSDLHSIDPAWDNVFFESQSLGYVNAAHQLTRYTQERSVLTWYLPLTADVQGRPWLMQLSHRDVVELVLADLSRAHPDIAKKIVRIDAMRWGHAMVQPVPGLHTSGLLKGLARPLAPHVVCANSDMSGLSTFEEAYHHGVAAARAAELAIASPSKRRASRP